MVSLFFVWTIYFYFEERQSKHNYLAQLKIKRLIKEQRNILEKLPDGLIIHKNKGQNVDVKYLNKTFNAMFLENNESMVFNQTSIVDLSKVYLRKTEY